MDFRIPPQNIEAEESILATIFYSPQDHDEIFSHLTKDDFYRTAYKIIFDVCYKLYRKKEPIELLSVTEMLRQSGRLGEVGGAVSVVKIIEDCPQAVNAKHTIGIIKGKHALRTAIIKSNEIINACFDQTDSPIEIIDRAQKSMLEIESTGIGKENFISMHDLTYQSIDRYEDIAKNKKTGVLTGFKKLDYVTNGLSGSKLIILAGRPRMGKTTLMKSMSRNMASHGFSVGIFSIEMDKEEIDDGFMAIESGISLIKLSTGNGLGQSDWEKIHAAAQRKVLWNITIDDTGGLTIMELCRRARIMKKNGVEIIFIDQFSKIKNDKNLPRHERKAEIVELLGDLKKELKIPIVLLAQINREIKNRACKKPVLEDLKDTGQLEEEADMVFFIHREEEYLQEDDSKKKEYENLVDFEVAKFRGGPQFWTKLYFDKKRTYFSDIVF